MTKANGLKGSPVGADEVGSDDSEAVYKLCDKAADSSFPNGEGELECPKGDIAAGLILFSFCLLERVILNYKIVHFIK